MHSLIRHGRGTARFTRGSREGALVTVTHGKVYVLDLAGMRVVIAPAGRRNLARPR